MELLYSTSQSISGATGSSGVSLVLTEDSNVPNETTVEHPVSNTPIPGVVERYHHFVKSPADKRVYRGLLLTNGLKVLLVSDPTIDQSAAALEVQVGLYNDPEEIPGLAHFCEHMVFLGTKKYPKENEFSKFVSENGGYSNAYTTSDSTVFYFGIRPPHLNEALDMFAQFFISPLFTESATDRELNAVNSEHENYISMDAWRLNAISKHICDVTHPYHKFGTGNKETLEVIPESKGIDVRDELLKFHKKWYSANIMSLVVIGKESLNDLEAVVAPLFATIEDKSVTAPSWPLNPFPPELLRKKIYGIPIMDIRILQIVFPIPDTIMYYKSKPTDYLSHLIGHEGPGSLLSALKKRSWCNSLSSGVHIPARGFGFFEIEVDLTEDGLQHADDIVSLLFQYIALLKINGPQKWVWEECKNCMEINFRFKDAQDPLDLVGDVVQLLQNYPIEDVLSVYSLNPEWKPELITEILSYLSPENANLYIVAQAFEDKCNMTVPWYGTKYCVEDIDDSLLKEWSEVQLSEELHLPKPNEFIPSNLDLDKSVDSTCENIGPAIIKDTKLMRLWYKKDNEFLLPKAMITFDFVSPLAYSDPVNANLTELLVRTLLDSLQEITYSAALAGLSWSVTRIGQYGINISVDGYDCKIHVLLNMIIDHLVSFKVEPKRFEIIVEGRIRDIKNIEADQPTELASTEENVCLSCVHWSSTHNLGVIKDLTPRQLEEFAANFIRKVHIEGLMYGNLSRARAIKIADLVEDKFPKDVTHLLAEQLLLNRDIELDKGVWFVRQIHNSIHRSSCASLYYGCGEKDTRQSLMLILLSNLLSEPCFSTLRTKEQLGYVVDSTPCFYNGTQGLRVTVQGHKHPYIVEQRIETFVQEFVEHLENMDDEEFSKHKKAVLASILEKPKQMYSKFAQLWGEIIVQEYNFDRATIEVEELNSMTKDEILQFYKKHLKADSPDRQKLSVYVVSTTEGGIGNEKTNAEQEQSEKDLDKKELHEKDSVKTDEEQIPEEKDLDKKELYEKDPVKTTEEQRAEDKVKIMLKENELDENKNEENKELKINTQHPNEKEIEENKSVKEEPNEKKIYEIPSLNTDKEPVIITDMLEFKSRRRLCPNPKPFTNIPRKGIH